VCVAMVRRGAICMRVTGPAIMRVRVRVGHGCVVNSTGNLFQKLHRPTSKEPVGRNQALENSDIVSAQIDSCETADR
jgi:hypothetical protein